MPLGFIMGRVFRWPWFLALPAGFITSLVIETAQLTGAFGLVGCAYRHFDVDDLMWNTSGALIGLIVAALANWIAPPRQPDAPEVVLNPSFLHRCVAMAIDLVLTYAISSSLGFGVVVLINRAAAHRPNGDYAIAGWSASPDALRTLVLALNIGFLLFFEFLLPLLHRGQTLGGSFTHMSAETKVRHGWLRAAFYLTRTAVVLAVFGPWTGQARVYMSDFAILLLVFYLFKRQMPYDLIPASEPDPPAAPLPAAAGYSTGVAVAGGYPGDYGYQTYGSQGAYAGGDTADIPTQDGSMPVSFPPAGR
ncbi:hypothetical protein KIM372_00100 [Bombiscardovia nodaiensis]|uniref:VanZ-like domain-containing protein n=1 Tax=Bombiscardovia nodaiensis TaxID=2932181 RepID=A0ABM8B5H6_9BIFI|nr:hypothetical protein KIM372_00100 [Bombiscardovia nodaiensis]